MSESKNVLVMENEKAKSVIVLTADKINLSVTKK